jgi:hypothetical protein
MSDQPASGSDSGVHKIEISGSGTGDGFKTNTGHNEAVKSETVKTESNTGTWGEDLLRARQRYAIVIAVLILAILPFGYPFKLPIFTEHFYIGGFRGQGFFYVLALLPGVAAALDLVFRTQKRRAQGERAIENYYKKSGTPVIEGTGDGTSPFTSGITAAIFLSAVFLLVAAFADRFGKNLTYTQTTAIEPVAGIIFCGLGAYVSVLYYFGARLYANAISSSFLMTSALRSASAVAFGWVAVSIGVTNALPAGATQVGALFMSGLFFSWAIGALRARAMTWFGAPKTDNEELPLGIVEGIDDTTADLLNEYGITTIQHLVETDPAELCSRTLLPLNRVIGWVNQAFLINDVKRNIVAFRAAGKGSATKLARCYALAQADNQTEKKVLEGLSAKSGLGEDIVHSIAATLLANKTVQFFHEFVEGDKLNAPRDTVKRYVADELKHYDYADGRFQIKKPTETQG